MHTDGGSMTTPITSTELNYLVFRYLAESGFTHSGFAFGFEAGINKSTIDENLVPPGGLITLVQKGIQYLELEANMLNDDLDTDEDFQFMNPLELLSKDTPELQKIIKQRKENGQKDSEGKDKVKPSENVMDANHVGDTSNGKLEENANNGGPEPMDVSMSLPSWPREIPNSDVTVLEGHTSEVFSCAWSPTDSLLASGSGDSTARIWTVDGPSSSNMNYGPSSIVLRHLKERPSEKTMDVTTLDWNVDGTVLATGCYDGQARLWAKHGELLNTLRRHRGPIFSLKWNKKGDYLLSGSMDKTAIVWDVKTATWKQVFEFHSAPLLDVDWRNNVSFATCSADSMIYVCKVGENRPIKTFRGHQGEINAIKWDPSGSVLASCSDDRTVKIWSMKQDTYLLELKEHSKEIYSVGWSPTGLGTNNPNRKLLLASASFDSTIKLWDVEVGRLLNNLAGHRHEVYSVAFSPDGKYLASGSLDKSLLIWSVQEAKIIKRFSGHAGVFEVCWNKEGNKIAACFADSKVCVMDFLM